MAVPVVFVNPAWSALDREAAQWRRPGASVWSRLPAGPAEWVLLASGSVRAGVRLTAMVGLGALYKMPTKTTDTTTRSWRNILVGLLRRSVIPRIGAVAATVPVAITSAFLGLFAGGGGLAADDPDPSFLRRTWNLVYSYILYPLGSGVITAVVRTATAISATSLVLFLNEAAPRMADYMDGPGRALFLLEVATTIARQAMGSEGRRNMAVLAAADAFLAAGFVPAGRSFPADADERPASTRLGWESTRYLRPLVNALDTLFSSAFQRRVGLALLQVLKSATASLMLLVLLNHPLGLTLVTIAVAIKVGLRVLRLLLEYTFKPYALTLRLDQLEATGQYRAYLSELVFDRTLEAPYLMRTYDYRRPRRWHRAAFSAALGVLVPGLWSDDEPARPGVRTIVWHLLTALLRAPYPLLSGLVVEMDDQDARAAALLPAGDPASRLSLALITPSAGDGHHVWLPLEMARLETRFPDLRLGPGQPVAPDPNAPLTAFFADIQACLVRPEAADAQGMQAAIFPPVHVPAPPPPWIAWVAQNFVSALRVVSHDWHPVLPRDAAWVQQLLDARDAPTSDPFCIVVTAMRSSSHADFRYRAIRIQLIRAFFRFLARLAEVLGCVVVYDVEETTTSRDVLEQLAAVRAEKTAFSTLLLPRIGPDDRKRHVYIPRWSPWPLQRL
jgi:hypothetical protein